MMECTEDHWQIALDAVIYEQVNSLKAFFEGNHVFVNLTTGYLKSSIFHCLLYVANVLQNKPCGSNIIAVICQELHSY